MSEYETVGARIALRRAAERRLRQGHLWVYSNEVMHPDPAPPAGTLVHLEDHRGRYLATAAYHPHGLIAARIWSSRREEAVDATLLRRRLEAAAERRRTVVPGWQAHRLVHAEADRLPGVVVDRYGQLAVVQSTSAFTDRLLDDLADLLVEGHDCTSVLLRNDARGRSSEGLPAEVRWMRGGGNGPWTVDEAGAPIRFDPVGGQKTGLFLDMRSTRDRIEGWMAGRRLLELHAYVGMAGIRAARAGAEQVTLVDSSQAACELARLNAAESQVADRVQVECADARTVVRDAERGSFDAVICDPPSLIQRRKDVKRGSEAYRRLNYLAMRVLRPGGLLVTCSCSHQLTWERFGDLIASAAQRGGRRLVQVYRGGAAPDHPVSPGHAQTDYLRCLVYLVDGEPRGGN